MYYNDITVEIIKAYTLHRWYNLFLINTMNNILNSTESGVYLSNNLHKAIMFSVIVRLYDFYYDWLNELQWNGYFMAGWRKN